MRDRLGNATAQGRVVTERNRLDLSMMDCILGLAVIGVGRGGDGGDGAGIPPGVGEGST